MRHFLIVLLFLAYPAQAEIYKLVLPSESGMRFYWWPVLPEIKGWHHDREYSLKYSSNAQAPDGYTFANAETVIYSKALFKPRNLEIKSISQLIKNDKKEFLSRNPKLNVKEVTKITNGDGIKLSSFTFFDLKNGSWEQVSYLEEGEFYLLFTISSRSKNGFKSAFPAYEKFIGNYKAIPNNKIEKDVLTHASHLGR